MNRFFQKTFIVCVSVVAISLSFYVAHASILGLQSLQTTTPSAPAPLSLSFASVYDGPVGTEVLLTGTGFSAKSNTVNLGKRHKITNIAARSAEELVFTIPKTVSVGRYDVSVSAGGKTTETLPFMVTTAGAALPVIEKIEPAEATFGQPIKITGKNFTAKDNIVSTNMGIVRGLASKDGKTLSFTLPLPEYFKNMDSNMQKVWFGTKNNLYWPVWVRVVNINGLSIRPESSTFVINI